jgi:hypothetical protein
MRPHDIIRRAVAATGVLAAVAVGVGTSGKAEADDATCAVADVEYSVTASLLLKDTKFGVADGVYPLGSGKLRLRFEPGTDAQHPRVALMSYELDPDFTVKASFAFWSTTVVTHSQTRVARACDGAAQGTYNHGEVAWSTPVSGYRSDGTLSCSGNVCGHFGAPPPGESPLHEPPVPVWFNPLRFGADGHTLSMAYAKISHTDSPSKTSYLALAGRETHRSCVTPAPCR